MSGYIADENFPYPSFEFLLSNGIDIIHVGTQFPSIADYDVIEIAVKENRLLITLDRDHGELIFTGTIDPPRGVIYFRIPRYSPTYLGEVLLDMIAEGMEFEGFFTVVTRRGTRRRAI